MYFSFPDCLGSSRTMQAASRTFQDRYGPTRRIPGCVPVLSRMTTDERSSRIIPEVFDSQKLPGLPPGRWRMPKDHPGHTRTIPDHSGQVTDRTPDRYGLIRGYPGPIWDWGFKPEEPPEGVKQNFLTGGTIFPLKTKLRRLCGQNFMKFLT